MKKYQLAIIGVLLFGFLAITFWNQISDAEKNKEITASQAGNSHSDIRQFWEYYHTATDLRVEEQYPEAANYYRRVLSLNPVHEDALYYMGNVQMQMGHYQEAKKSWHLLITKNRFSSRGHSQLGMLYFCTDKENDQFDLVSSREHFKRAAELNREETGPLLNLSKINLLHEQYNRSEKYLNDITSTNFMNEEAFFLLGYLAWRDGNHEKAGRNLTRSAEIVSKYSKSDMAGEGATKSGSSPMILEDNRCDFIGNTIQNLLGRQASDSQDIPADQLYHRFAEKMAELRKALSIPIQSDVRHSEEAGK
ncbi:MAG: tetratricopeptide repeat protein [Balneolaceae bacterium]|nr:tetratricopeptide repeat protein [Balneolaceae bacterium]